MYSDCMNDQIIMSIEDPMLRNHTAYGQELLPGLAYIDLIYQFFRERDVDFRSLELRNLSIYNPLIVTKDCSVRLDITCSCSKIKKDTAWKIQIDGREMRQDGVSKRYAIAQMHHCEPVQFEETMEPSVLSKDAASALALHDVYQRLRNQELVHTGPMKAQGYIYSFDDADVIRVAVPQEALTEAYEFMFHPALIDGSGVGAGNLLHNVINGEHRLFLPLHFGLFRASSLIQERCITRIPKASIVQKKELIYLDMEFFSESGQKIGELKHFANKLVREAQLINPQRAVAIPGLTDSDVHPRESQQSKQSIAEETKPAADTSVIETAASMITNIVASHLDTSADAIDQEAGYYELGLTSALLLEIVAELEKRLSVSLSPTLLFEYTTISALALYLSEEYRPVLARMESEHITENTAHLAVSGSAQAIPVLFSSGKEEVSDNSSDENGDIAIIGMAGRYPQADTVWRFWQNLTEGRDCITKIPANRWDWHRWDAHETTTGKKMSKWGGFIDHPEYFDPQFFRISPREAFVLDPQERLFLEVCWEAIEDAGYTVENLVPSKGKNRRRDVGVFVGAMHKDYTLIGAEAVLQGEKIPLSLNYAPIANRVSFFCDFHGPSMAVDTVCSSSLVAIHLALESIKRGESLVALAGGVNLSLHPNKYMTYGMMDMHSSDGHCRTFGEGGDGYVSGEGIGAVLLKPLKNAIADGDHIYAVIKGSVVNHVGKVSGIFVPSPVAQGDMIQRCFEQTGIDPRTISYIEAHGTGTALGDPIEIQGLVSAFGHFTSDKQYCAIGSVKSNIGHAESAAGISGLTKTVLQLYHKTLVPSLHSETVNPYINLSDSPFYIQHKTEPWRQPSVTIDGTSRVFPRRAGISSFGATGTNAHIILEEYTQQSDDLPQILSVSLKDRGVIVPLSAKNEDRLQEYAVRTLTFLKNRKAQGMEAENENADSFVVRMAYTLQTGRKAMESRAAFWVKNSEELLELLEKFVSSGAVSDHAWKGHSSDRKKVVASLKQNDISAEVTGWVSQGKFDQIAQMWVKGFDIDWSILYDTLPPRRISLPTYPFAKESYWITMEKSGSADSKPDIPHRSVYSASPLAHALPLVPTSAATPAKPSAITLRSLSESEKHTFPSQQHTVSQASSVLEISVSVDTGSGDDTAFQASDRQISDLNDVHLLQRQETGVSNSSPARQSISRETLEKQLAESLAKTLYLKESDVDAEKSFIDMGLDSIVGVEWIRAINKKYSLNITATKVYDYPTIRELAWYVKEELDSRSAASAETATQSLPVHITESTSAVPDDSRKEIQSPDQSNFPLRHIERIHDQPPRSDASGEEQYGLVVTSAHTFGELSLKKWEIADPAPGEVMIEVKASAINFPDTMCVKGLYPTMPDYPFVPGFEVSGIVYKVGREVLGIDIGDAVIGLTGSTLGGHASYVNVPAENIMHKPSAVTFEEACSLPVVFGTVFYAFERAGLSANEHVLIQTATGGCGLVALQLARLKHCVCYGTSSRPQKLDLLRQLGVPHVINYKTSEFDREIRQITHNRGVDVVLNTLAGDGIQKGLNCLAPSGRYLEIAVHALKTSPKLDLSRLVQNQTVYSIDLRRLSNGQDGLMGTIMFDTMRRLLEQELIVPIVSRIYPFHQIVDALEYVGRGEHIGKVVISHTRQTMQDCRDLCIERMVRQKKKAEQTVSLHRSVPSVSLRFQRETAVEEIAIIGMAGQFPKSGSLDLFWDNIARGNDCISEVPAARWAVDEYYQPGKPVSGKTYCKWMGVLEEADMFDPLFFSIAPSEAEWMDPQQRLFLENAWRCIEDAGIDPLSLSGSLCGVFAGCGGSDYGQSLNKQKYDGDGLTGVSTSILPARISYLLNLKGPCLAIDTACSSSLVAIAQACTSLIAGSSDIALAGGVCVLPGPMLHIMTSRAGMLSADGRCFTFDKKANGFVPGEGVGVILLKRLSDAKRDRDRIYGIIKGWGINHDGKTNGITAPSAKSQIALQKEVFERFGINPETISMVEAHGTGTKLGDPIEVEALIGSFGLFTDKKHFCALGSVKSNIGHLLTAAGISGVLKVLLSLQHRMLPPAAHFTELNPHIDLENSPFYINTGLQPWNVAYSKVRRASVSSFGFSGTNSYLVIEEYNTDTVRSASLPIRVSQTGPCIVPLSAKNDDRLKTYARNLLHFIRKQETENVPLDLRDLAYTFQTGRSAMEERLGMMVMSLQELTEKLQRFVDGQHDIEGVFRGNVKHGKETLASLEDDNDMTETIAAWIRNGKIHTFLDLWVKGLNFDWNRLYTTPKPCRISAPTYPFAREQYWISSAQEKGECGVESGFNSCIHPLLQENVSDFNKQKFSSTDEQWDQLSWLAEWEEISSPVDMKRRMTGQKVLLVYSESSFHFEKAIRNYYQNYHTDAMVIGIRIDNETRQLSKQEWSCSVMDHAGFETCLREWEAIDTVFFLSADPVENQSIDWSRLAQSPQKNEFSLLRLLKVLMRGKKIGTAADCYILTLDNYRIDGSAANPYGGGVTGLTYALSHADHRFRVRNIDLSYEELSDSEKHTELVRMIMNEAASDRAGVVKYMSGRRYRQSFVKMYQRHTAQDSALKHGGVYVILGGSGRVGRSITRSLVQVYNAKVVWIGRTPHTSRELKQKMETFDAWGEPPLYIQADATQWSSMKEAVNIIKTRYPRIDGAIFSGLVFDFENAISQTTEAAFKDIFDIKAIGSCNFYRAFENEPLDFICYFSSAQAFSFSGAARVCGYASGITFSDTFVNAIQNTARFPVGIINWGFWEPPDEEHAFNNTNIDLLKSQEGFGCFDRFISQALQPRQYHHVICLKATEHVLHLMHPERTNDTDADFDKPDNSDTVMQAETAESDDISELFINDIVVQALSRSIKVPVSSLQNDIPFSDYGVDSIIGTRFIERINEMMDISVNPAVIFDHTTISRLTAYLFENFRERITAALPSMKGKNQKSSTSFSSCQGIQSRQPRNGNAAQHWKKQGRLTIVKESAPYRDTADIAVIGMSGQFPGAEDVQSFWQNLIQGKDMISELPAHYLDQKRYFSPQVQPGKSYCKWGGILEDRACFDPLFFNLSPREAESMNPHQRLILQESWKALEDAGYNPRRFENTLAGVFIGSEPTSYPAPSIIGASDAIIASRLSYYLNLKGPAFVVNTACSSSGVAIHLACESLRRKESNLVLAGGVFAALESSVLVGLSGIGMLSPVGRCHTFDESANGTVLSEGVGIVVLKRLADAVADGDAIYGVIKGSGVNQDGASNGITAPNGAAQEQLIAAVYERFHIDPEQISYIEAHGTGTRLGDPVEANALIRAFKRFTGKKEYCCLGSVKSFIGHTAAAAGVTGLIKVLLSLQHRQIPGQLHFKKLNPLIELDGSAFVIKSANSQWKSENGTPLLAAVNSFGHSGTNVHLVVGEYQCSSPVQKPVKRMGMYTPVLVPLSAKSDSGLKAYAQKLISFLKTATVDNRSSSTVNLIDIAYTFQVGREPMKKRVVFRADTVMQLMTQLELFYQGKSDAAIWVGQQEDTKKLHLLTNDDDARQMVQQWIGKRKLNKLAELWVHGFDIPWELLYPKDKPRRISLPTYPFSRKRYWYGLPENEQHNSAAAQPAQSQSSSVLNPVNQPNYTDREEAESDTTGLDQSGYPGENNSAQMGSDDLIRHNLDRDLAKIVAGILKLEMEHESIGLDQPLYELGFTSITVNEFIAHVNSAFGTTVTVEFFFELKQPTIKALSELFFDRFKNILYTYYTGQSSPKKVSRKSSRQIHDALVVSTSDEKEKQTAEYVSELVVMLEEMSRSDEKTNTQAVLFQNEADRNETHTATNSKRDNDRSCAVMTNADWEQIECDILTIASKTLKLSGTAYEPESVDRFVEKLNRQFGLSVTADHFLKNPSLGSLIKQLIDDYQANFIKYYEVKNGSSHKKVMI